MLVLITYDVSTVSDGGKRRLRRVAKTCCDYGQRVQNSVFECVVDHAQWVGLKQKLLGEIDPALDSLRFYYLGREGAKKVEHHGTKDSVDVENDLLLL